MARACRLGSWDARRQALWGIVLLCCCFLAVQPQASRAQASETEPSVAEPSQAEDGQAKPASVQESSQNPSAEAGSFQQLKGYLEEAQRSEWKLLVIPIEGMIDAGLAALVTRSLSQVDERTVVLLRVSTFGGRVDSAVQIRDQILALPVPTIAYVEHRAISAGALISLAADTLIMDSTASIGAVTPVQTDGTGPPKATSEKVVSYMRAEMRATAEATGRRADLAEAMVDADIEVEGVSEKGKLLTLTARDARQLELADAVVSSFEELLQAMGLSESTRVEPTSDWGEQLASFLTNPTVASLLMSLGMLGLMLEFYSPGFGWGGAIGLTCLVLFFGGHWAAHLAGLEEVLLLCAGIALLALEVFVIPGFGIAGVSGLLLMVAALFFAMLRFDLPLGVAYDLGYLQDKISSAVIRLGLGFGLMVALALLVVRYVPKAASRSFLVFREEPGPASGAGVGTGRRGLAGVGQRSAAHSSGPQRGDTGVTLTVLRPAGIAQFDGHRTHVVSEGPVVEPGVKVKVVSVEGAHVVVAVA